MARLGCPPRARRSRLGLLLAAAVAVNGVTPVAPAFAQATSAKAALAAGDKAARAKDWLAALAQYEAAQKAAPSAQALEGIARARSELDQPVEALAAYQQFLRDFGAKLPRAKKAAVEARIQDLEAKTGLVTFTVDQAGAEITVDGKPVGTSPLPAPVRLPAGPHRVRVSKEGFVPFDQAPNVPSGGAATVAVTLEPQTTKGRLAVKEKTGKAIRVLVDGVDVGEAPWTGEVEAGAHEVAGRSPTLVATPERVTVERGKTREVELVASANVAPVKVVTSDNKGLIYLDGKLVGEGAFVADVLAGPHTLRVTREGYDPFEEEIVVKANEPLARSVTLKLVSTIETGPVEKDVGRLEGLYGGFGLLYTFLPGGMKSTMQKTCEGDGTTRPPELVGCSGEGGSVGGALDGFIGYHWDPVGVELFAGAQYDQASPTLTWADAGVDPGIGFDPARKEEFTLRRLGGFGVARMRFTIQGEKLRFSVAGGVGLSYRSMLLERLTTATANPALRDAFVPDAQSYLSPILSLEPSIQYRLGRGTALALGVSLLVESPRAFDQIPTTPPDGTRRLGPSGLTTRPYELATDTQIFLGPFVGMMFGP